MKIAITAASGQLGRAIVKATAAMIGNEHVIGIARTLSRAQDLGVEVRQGSYDERDEMRNALADVDSVLLVSGMDAPDKRIAQHRNVIEAAQAAGEIANCAGEGKCGYTTRAELGFAYARLLTQAQGNGRTLNLHGEPISQSTLARLLGDAFGTPLRYRAMDVDDYRRERVAELGDFIGNVVAGIYQGIRLGAYDAPSDFARAAQREHQTWSDCLATLAMASEDRAQRIESRSRQG